MNKLMHGIVLAVFGLACWSISVILDTSRNYFSALPHQLPTFTRFCLALGPIVLTSLINLAAIYCIVVWVRKKEQGPSWGAFLATTMSTVVLLMLPTFLALYLPIIDLVMRLPHD